MKNILNFFLLALLGIFLFSCGGNANSSEDQDDYSVDMADDSPGSTICLWPEVGLREGAGRTPKYITTVYFGEKVESTGDTAIVEGDDRTYIKVKLSDGTTGWANRYLFAENSRLGAITNLTSVYKRPDLVTNTNKKFDFGEIVAVGKSEGEWVEVVGKEKSIAGWIKGEDHLTTEGTDVSVAILRSRALAISNPTEKKKALEDLQENSDFRNSIFVADLADLIDELDPMKRLKEGQLMITADNVNVRSSPTTTEENKVFQLKNGEICDVLEIGDEETIGSQTDNWYKISCTKGEGWVFGSFALVNMTE
ncbi:MAG: SH3 domain-containing protein [Bacteroidia bacterium]|nr:SH3 domain-containing protein [Bacteroidia bacterium]